jgi:hypothetical protein
MKTGSGLLNQLERCGLSAQLADLHREASEDSSGFRLAKIEIARSYAAADEATIPEASAAMHWLMGHPGEILSVGETVDLIDQTTGEVLVTGRPGAVLASPNLVVSWRNADAFDESEPEDDLGLVAMGLASFYGQPFQAATLAIRGMEVFPRRSSEIAPDKHPALLERIRKAVGRPRVACPGAWCGACRQNVYCPAWMARAKVALAALPVSVDAVTSEAIQLELTNENSGEFSERIAILEKVVDLAKDLRKSFVRNGGTCRMNGKVYKSSLSKGRESADVQALKVDGLTKYIKVGQPFETFRWVKG